MPPQASQVAAETSSLLNVSLVILGNCVRTRHIINNNFRADGPRTLPPPHILLQLGLAYMLHRSNSSAQVFELERDKHDQAQLPSCAHGLQYPARDPHPSP